MLYASTKAAKHLQRDIVRGVEAFIAISSKQMEIVNKLAEDCCKYGTKYQDFGFPLASGALNFGTSHSMMEKERANLLTILGDQVYEPIRAMIIGAPLEDARFLTYRYDRIRQDVEAQTAEVLRRQLKSKEVVETTDVSPKLQHAESKLQELRTTLSALGREATAAMMAVEDQQQQNTFNHLLAMVDAERAYYQSVANILDKLHDEMVQMKDNHGSVRQAATIETIQNDDSKTSQSYHVSVTQAATTEIMQSQTGNEDSNTSPSHQESVTQAATTETVQRQTGNEDSKRSQSHHVSVTQTATTETMQSQTGNEDVKTSRYHHESVTQTATTEMQSQKDDNDSKASRSGDFQVNGQNPMYFVAQVVHSFDAQADGELSLSVGDYVVVRQVAPNGWSEGECKEKAGWFPSAYVERRDKAPASKVIKTH
ncbi:SH3 domain-containing protein 2-like isoform X2 [Musa acuminata AAA Group]